MFGYIRKSVTITDLKMKSFATVLGILILKLLLLNFGLITSIVSYILIWCISPLFVQNVVLKIIPIAFILSGIVFFDELGHVTYRFLRAENDSEFQLKIKYTNVLVLVQLPILYEASILMEAKYESKLFYLLGYLFGLGFVLIVFIYFVIIGDIFFIVETGILTLIYIIVSLILPESDISKAGRGNG